MDTRLQKDTSADRRFINYPHVVEAIEDRPLLGYGLGAFDPVHLTYRSPDEPGWFNRAHSDYLELAHTAGIPAAVWFLMALGIAIVFLVRRLVFGLQYRAFIALGITTSLQLAIHSTVDFSLQMPAVSYLWVAILAVSLAIAHRCELIKNVIILVSVRLGEAEFFHKPYPRLSPAAFFVHGVHGIKRDFGAKPTERLRWNPTWFRLGKFQLQLR